MPRGPGDDPVWARPALAALLTATAVLYVGGLGASGWANPFYSAAVQAGAHSWKAFFFGSSDAANFITVDKTPLSLWPMDLTARVFGVNAWSILVPQALMGVATVAILYATVRRSLLPFGARAAAGGALLAGAVLATTPVAALMFRFNNPDALLVLLLTAGSYALLRAREQARTTWLLLAASCVGLGFLAKMAQAFLVVPAFGLVYLLTAPTPVRRRLWQLALAGAALVVSAGWWVAIVAAVPAGSRPYIGGSQHDSVLELALGYNGLGRLNGNETGGLGNTNQDAGWLRMFDPELGGQIAWLLPAALTLLVAGLWVCVRASSAPARSYEPPPTSPGTLTAPRPATGTSPTPSRPDRPEAEGPPTTPQPDRPEAGAPPATPQPDRPEPEGPPATPQPDRPEPEGPPATPQPDHPEAGGLPEPPTTLQPDRPEIGTSPEPPTTPLPGRPETGELPESPATPQPGQPKAVELPESLAITWPGRRGAVAGASSRDSRSLTGRQRPAGAVRGRRTDRGFAALLLWGGWLLVTGVVFSLMQGIFHGYYTVALAPPVAALTGIGTTVLWLDRRRPAAAVALAMSAALTAWWSHRLLGRTPDFVPWLSLPVLVGGLIAAVVLLGRRRLPARVLVAGAAVAITTALAGPAAYAIDTATTPQHGAIPTAGPSVRGRFPAGPRGGFPGGGPPGGPGGGFGRPPGGGMRQGGAPPGGVPSRPSGVGGMRAGMGGLLDAATPSATVTAYLKQNATSYTWAAATVGSNSAAGYQLATGRPVMAIGGFNGTDPAPSLTRFEQLVRAGRIHYFVSGSMTRGGTAQQITNWVTQNFTARTVDGTTVYDLTP